MRLLLPLFVATIVLAGCFGSGKTLSQGEAEDAAKEAMEAFAADFTSSDGGDLTKVSGTFESDIGTGGGSASVDFTMEWGQGGASFAQIDMASGGASFAVSLYCVGDVTVLVYGDAIIESRPTQGACLDAFGEGGDPLEVEGFSDLDLLEAEPQKGGGVIARFDDDNGTVTIHVDAKRRVTRLEFDTEQGAGRLDVAYTPRRTIEAPEATARMPINVFGSGFFFDGAYQWSGAGEETAPFDEIEIRVTDPDGNVVASFPAGADGTDSGFVLDYTDDGDGIFSSGDTFTLRGESWTSDGDYEVVVWDTWADREVGDIPVPGLGVLAVVAAIGVALVARR